MSKCTRCHRELKNHTESGMGKICQMKANRLHDSSDLPRTTIEMVYDNKRGHRNYLVRTEGRGKVFVAVFEGAVKCHNCPATSAAMCEHASLVAEFERTAFPETVSFAPVAPAAATAENSTGADDIHTTRNGERVPIRKLADDHLLNILPKVRYTGKRFAYYREANRRGLLIQQFSSPQIN